MPWVIRIVPIVVPVEPADILGRIIAGHHVVGDPQIMCNQGATKSCRVQYIGPCHRDTGHPRYQSATEQGKSRLTGVFFRIIMMRKTLGV